MKKLFGVLVVSILFLTQACSAGTSPETSSPQEPVNPPATEISAPTPEVVQSGPEVSTSVALNSLPTIVTETLVPGGNPIPETGITLEDRGKTFHLKVGDSFLLNLGTDVYNWTVTVDNESVLHLKMGVMVIKGAQGIYDALTPGTATLSAAGDPICLQSNPPCASPSILFTVTILVK
ncbi:MAG: hypothetical protein ABI904_16075 [Chloroflexota bacterium]